MSRLDGFCGACDDHDEHDWTNKHDYDFYCPGWHDNAVSWAKDNSTSHMYTTAEIAKMPTPTPTPTPTPFNWHEASIDSFAHWAVIAMITDGQHPDLAQDVIEASEGAQELLITLEINGIHFDGMPFFERLWQEMMRQADIKAAERAKEFIGELTSTSETVQHVLDIAAADVRARFRAAGLPMEEDDEW
jgi:hypothetical protein